MKRLSSICAFILCITSSSHQLYGIDVNAEKKVNILATFQMKVLYDGLPCNDSVLVSLKIYSDQDKIHAKWIHAYSKLFEESGVGVRIQQFTTFNDTITNLEVGKNSFELTLHYDTEAPLKISATEKNGHYHIEGIGFWWDDIFKRKVRVKWYSIDTMPYYHTEGGNFFL